MEKDFLDKIILENIKTLVFESQESKSQSQAVAYLQKEMGLDYDKAYDFVRIHLRQYVKALRHPKLAKFTLGVARMYVNKEIGKNPLERDTTDDKLSATLFAMLPDINKYDKNLNNLSAQELIDMYSQIISDGINQEMAELNSTVFNASDYKIVKINSFSEAKKYSSFLPYRSKWCITTNPNLYIQYTKNNLYQIYFCLKNNFKKIRPVCGENAPLDEYGLSMLSVIVNENGRLVNCTCRWNGSNGGSDNVMNAKELSQLLGVNFYSVFKPVSNDLQRVQLEDGKWNIKNSNGNYLFNFSFDSVEPFLHGFARVKYQNKYNFVNAKNGKLVSKYWFDYANDFDDYYAFTNNNSNSIGIGAYVEKDGECNFLNKNGKLIYKNWFDGFDGYYDGCPCVSINNKWVIIDNKGNILENKEYKTNNSIKKQVIRLTEGDLHNIIRNSVNVILENKFKNYINRIKVAQHMQGKSDMEKRKDLLDFLAKTQAISDINKSYDYENLEPHEREFIKSINYKTFDTDFYDLNYEYEL